MPIQFLVRFAVFLACGFGLSLITQHAPNPEKSESLWFALPAFLVFVLFVGSLFSWGAWVRKRVNLTLFSVAENCLFDLAVGSTIAYLVSYALSPFGLFYSRFAFLLWVFLAIGFGLGSGAVTFKGFLPTGKSKWAVVFAIIPLLMVFIKLLEALQFHQHGDAYVAYLTAPRSWAALGNFSQYTQYTEFFLSTSFESLFGWGTALMGFTGGQGLDISQWFSQWVTGGIGVLGLVLGMTALCQRLAILYPINMMWIPLIVIYAVQVPHLRWLQNLPKNDIGVSFWGVAAFYMTFFMAPQSAGLAFLAGLLTGATVIGKLTAIILGGCLGLVIIFKSPKRVIPFVLGGIVGILPVLGRNYALTQNPMFPWFANIFHSSHFNPADADLKQSVIQMAFHWADAWSYFYEIITQVPLWFVLPVALFLRLFSKKDWILLIAPVLSLLLFTVVLRPTTEIRYQGPTLILFAGYCAYFLFYILEKKIPSRISQLASFVLAIILIATSNITLFTLTQLNKTKFDTWPHKIVTLNQTGGPEKLWIREHIPSSEPVLVIGNSHIYYFLDYTLTLYQKLPDLYKPIQSDVADPVATLALIAKQDQNHVYFCDFGDNDGSGPHVAKMMSTAFDHWNHQCLEYQSQFSAVWNLNCVKTSK